VSQRAGLDGDGLPGHRQLGQRVVRRARAGGQAGREPGEGRLQQLDRAFVRAGHHRGERDAQEIEGGGEMADVEVAHRHDPALLISGLVSGLMRGGHDDRVGLRGVELDLQDVHDVAERVPGRAVDLR
jgi:hypothetical protein